MASTAVAENAEAVARPESPYVGLVPYEEGDADFFFGRSTEAAIVAMNLRTSRLTILYGPSGVGKTSLLMAGAVHVLRDEVREAGAESSFAVCVFRSWRDDPSAGVREAARAVLHGVDERDNLVETLRAWAGDARTLLVVFDQFEEYFQYHPDEGDDERLTGFAAEFARAVNDPTLPVHILLSIREDAWAKLDLFEGHVPALFANYVRVDHLDLDSAREAIEGPIDAWNRALPEGEEPYGIEPSLVDAVLAATAGGRLTLSAGGESGEGESAGDRVEAPFLQLVLDRLWRDTVARGERTLTLARLEALGGAARIVENHLLDALGRLTPAEREAASDCFRFLVSRSRTKIAHSASDLAEWTGRPEAEVTAVLDKLCTGESGRILRAVAPAEEDASPSYELFHDILAEPILDWRRTFEQERAHRLALRRFARIGAVLLALVAVFGALGVWALVQRSDARSATASATSLALDSAAKDQLAGHPEVSLLLALDAYRAHESAQSKSTMISALESALASGADAILRGHVAPVSSVAFSRDGSTLATGDAAGTVRLWDARTHRQLGVPIHGQTHRITSLAFSPDGATLATASENGTVRLWDVRTRAPIGDALRVRLSSNSEFPNTVVVFTRGGRALAATTDDYKSGLWDVRSGAKLAEPVRPEPGFVLEIPGVAFSADGRFLAMVDYEGLARIWSVPANKQVERWKTGIEPGSVSSIALSPDGKDLAVGNVHGIVRVLGVHGRKLLRPPVKVSPHAIISVAFGGPGGRTLVAGGADGSVSFLSLGARRVRRSRPLLGHTAAVTQVALSPEGTVASASDDRTVRLWSAAGAKASVPAGDHYFDFSNVVVFSRDGTTLAGASSDDSVGLWSLRTGGVLGQALSSPRPPPKPSCRTMVRNGHVSRVCLAPAVTAPVESARSPVAAAFSAAGRTLATAADGGRVRFWKTRSGGPSGEARSFGARVDALAFSPDGRELATNDGERVRLWDVKTGHELNRLRGRDVASSLAFSPDGRMLATGDADSVGLWDVATGQNVGQLLGPRGRVSSVAFSPDGRTVAAGSVDETVRLWDVHTQGELGRPLTGAAGTVWGVAFSPDGHVLATGNGDGTVRLWDVDSYTQLGAPIRASTQDVWSVAFGPDGRTLAASSSTEAVHVWKDILWHDRNDLTRRVCGLVSGDLTQDEWEVLTPGLAYRASCRG